MLHWYPPTQPLRHFTMAGGATGAATPGEGHSTERNVVKYSQDASRIQKQTGEGEGEQQPAKHRLHLLSCREMGPRERESLERAACCSVNEYLLQAKGKRQKEKRNVLLSAYRRALTKSRAAKPAVRVLLTHGILNPAGRQSVS